MRTITLFLVMLFAAPALADWDDYDYREERELTLATAGITSFEIDAGAGSLAIAGVDGAQSIDVRATVLVEGAEDDKAASFVERRMVLTLERDGDRARLVADFRDAMSFGKSGAIALDIRMPEGIDLRIDDGSGAIEVVGTGAAVAIDDGSGSIMVANSGDVTIDDGSGSINVSDVTGDVDVDDGSGSVTLERISGNVIVDDGSGSIRVADIGGNFTVIDGGSGSINHSAVAGRVNLPED